MSHENGNQKRASLKTLSKVEDNYVWTWANTTDTDQKTESGCIVPSQKNYGKLANNSSISCFKIMNKAAMPAEPDNNETNRA